MPAPNAAACCGATPRDPDIAARPAIRFGDRMWTHAEFVAESCRWANLFLDAPDRRGRHVGVLIDNTPDYLFAFGGAALSGSVVVGLNHTRRGEHLLRDIEHTHCRCSSPSPATCRCSSPIAASLPPVLVSHRYDDGAGGRPRRRAGRRWAATTRASSPTPARRGR